MDALYDEHKLDLSKASAAIAAAEDAARHVKGVRSETLVAELVQLRAEIRRLRLKSEEGDEDAEEEAESLGGVPATSRRRSIIVQDPSEEEKQMWMDEVQQQLKELCNKSVDAEDEMEEILSRQRQAEEREILLLHERAALQTQLEELQAQVEEANKQVAMTVKSGHEQALALERTQKECDTLRQECQRLSANSNNHADCMPQEKSTQTPPAIQEANGALGRGAHPARVAARWGRMVKCVRGLKEDLMVLSVWRGLIWMDSRMCRSCGSSCIRRRRSWRRRGRGTKDRTAEGRAGVRSWRS